MTALSCTHKTALQRAVRVAVIILALTLAVWVSVDTLKGVDFMEKGPYLTFQLWVCIAFIAIFFVQLYLAPKRWRFFATHFTMLLISIPCLNIVSWLDLDVSREVLGYLRLLPLARGVWAMVIVIRLVSVTKLPGIFWSYLFIVVLLLYFGALLFYDMERGVNPGVHDFWTALWWSSMEMTTIGASLNPVTATGKILAALLSGSGMVLFPLFTVYLTDTIRKLTASWADTQKF